MGVIVRVPEYERIQSEIDAHVRIIDELGARGDEILCRHYGLIPGETLLRSGDIIGVFLEILNYRGGKQVPWVRVRIVSPEHLAGKGRHFYEAGWEKVDA